MENKVITLPTEVEQIAQNVSLEKRNEVQSVLNSVFDGVQKMREQLDSVAVEDENDKVNMKLANTIRLSVRQVRLDAEKTFDAKRSEVQQQMLSYKTEDSLWLKAKQTMQILTKEIEENARWKEETKQRFESEQKELKTQQRILKVSKIAPDMPRSEFENMSDESFDIFFSGIEKQYNDRIEAERKAEEERIKKERIDKLYKERKDMLLPYWGFVPEGFKALNMGMATDMEFKSVLEDAKKAKSEHEKHQEAIRKENERLKKEREAEAEIRNKRAKELQPFIVFIRDYNGLISKSDDEYKKEFNDIKKGAEDHWEFERKQQIKKQKEEEALAEQLKKERINREKLEADANKRKADEAKAEAERIEMSKAPVKKQLNTWVNSFNIEIPSSELLKNEKALLIKQKFEAFKKWALNEIENI